MKAKLGGLSSYLSQSSSREKGINRYNRDESQSRESRKLAANQHRKYERLDDDIPIDNYYRREVDIDNEEDNYHSKHSKGAKHEAHTHETRHVKRSNSRDMLVKTSSIRNDERQYAKQIGKFDRDDITEQPQVQDRKLRLTKFTSDSNDYENFQHMRHQTKQCMDVLSRKVGNCLSNLAETINEFRNNLRRIVEDQYNKLETMVMNIVETMFTSELQNVRRLCKIEEKKMGKSISDVREDLELLYGKLQKMKDGIEGPGWKRFTGDFFREDIEGQVDQLLKKSEKLQVNRVIHMHFDQKREEDFKNSLQNLLQVHLTTSMETEARS